MPEGSGASGTGFDHAEALARFGGDRRLFAEMVQDFLHALPRMLTDLQAGVAAADWPAVERLAHRAKGNVAYFADPTAQAAARQLELAARTRDPAMVMYAWGEFRPALETLSQALEPFAQLS